MNRTATLCGYICGCAVALLGALLWTVAAAQTASEDIAVRFGFAGEIVANSWNPLHVTLRDASPAELLLELDVGSLRRGVVPFRYSAQLAGGQGLYTFEDDLYLPAWRSFSWLIRTPDRVLASGTVPRYRADAEPLQLIESREAGAGARLFAPAARVVEVVAADLPERAAAYRGVESIVLLPQTAPPTPAALAAAATAGSTVMFGEGMGSAYADISALVPTETQPLGAGSLNRLGQINRASVQRTLQARPHVSPDALSATLADETLTEAPAGLSATWLAPRVAAYAAALLLLVRFGGRPGILAALLLAGIFLLAAWRTRPAEPLLFRDRSVVLNGGALALRTDLHYLFSFPGGAAAVSYSAHPLPEEESEGYRGSPEGLEIDLPAYGSALLAGKPQLEPAALTWDGETVFNSSETRLTDVFVTWGGADTGGIGSVSRSGQQSDIGAGEALQIGSGSLMLPERYTDLEPLLPPGSVLARGGGTVYVLLPETP